MRTFRPLLCASGLAAEAKIARAAGFAAVVGGGDGVRTRSAIETAIAQAKCLVSFGIAGGLAPGLRRGTVVLSGEVIAEGERWRTEEPLYSTVPNLAREIGAVAGPVLGAPSILATPADKARAWAETGALAVDLESAIVARAAAAAGIPFIVLRAIADGAHRALPSAALIPLSVDGTPEVARILAAILRRPRQIAGLIGLAWESRAALAALAGSARVLHGLVLTP